jgi:hypothetical protein
MAITITLIGTDLKIVDGTDIEYLPVSEVKQVPVGTRVELYRNNELVRGDQASEYSSPSGTAEAICDAISALSSSVGVIQGSDPSNASIDLKANEVGNQIVADIHLEIEKGNVLKHSHVIVAASNVDIDTARETIWKHTGTWIPMTTARTMSIVSDNANDTSAGTGARTLLVAGIDASGEAQTEIVTMNGTTPVVTTSTWLGINPSIVLTAGSSMNNIGTILFTSSIDSDVQNVISPTDSLSSALIYHVPLNTTFYLKFIRSSVFKSSGGAANVIVDGFSATTGGVQYRIYQVDLTEDIMPLDVLDLNSYSPIAGGSYIYFSADSTVNNTVCRVAIEGVLVAD